MLFIEVLDNNHHGEAYVGGFTDIEAAIAAMATDDDLILPATDSAIQGSTTLSMGTLSGLLQTPARSMATDYLVVNCRTRCFHRRCRYRPAMVLFELSGVLHRSYRSSPGR